jgi:hypothetical protein
MTADDLRKALVGTACPECGAKYEPMESDICAASMVHQVGCSAPVGLTDEVKRMTLEELKNELHKLMFAVDNGDRSLDRAVEIVFSLIEDLGYTFDQRQVAIDYVCEQMRLSHWSCSDVLANMIADGRSLE